MYLLALLFHLWNLYIQCKIEGSLWDCIFRVTNQTSSCIGSAMLFPLSFPCCKFICFFSEVHVTWLEPWRIQLMVLVLAGWLVISLGPQEKHDATFLATEGNTERIAFQSSWLHPHHKQHNISASGKWEDPFFHNNVLWNCIIVLLPSPSELTGVKFSQGALYQSKYLFLDLSLYFSEFLFFFLYRTVLDGHMNISQIILC